jgi:hypothetical protein
MPAASGRLLFNRFWLREMNGKYPGHPQERKVESQEDDQAYL